MYTCILADFKARDGSSGQSIRRPCAGMLNLHEGPDETAPRPTELVERGFSAIAPNRLWSAGLTYVRTWSGFVWVPSVLDAYSRFICGSQTANYLRTDLALDALEMPYGSARQLRQRSAESMIGLYKAKVIRYEEPGKGLDQDEFATLEWVDSFNHSQLLEPIGHVPPAEFEGGVLCSRCCHG